MNIKNGIIILNKPTGMSSNTAVNKVKYAVGAKKTGHLGTLDPLGSGVLPITINKATRLFDYFLNKDKTYRAIFTFGYETDTLDSEGNIIKENNIIPTKESLEKTVKLFIGYISQMPPKYSSKNINGEKAYNLIRKNIDFDLKPKQVHISEFKLLEQVSSNSFLFEITCSSGTYIRSLCRDLAYKNNTYGTMSLIIRTRCGIFDIAQASSIDDVETNNYLFLDAKDIIDLDSYFLDDKYYNHLLHGIPIKLEKPLTEVKLFCNNEFFGIAKTNENNFLKIVVNLRED